MSRKTDQRIILHILNDGPATFAQISLRGGENLLPVLQELLRHKRIIKINNHYKLVDE